VPLTLARLPREAAFAVIEMGMNNRGEIAPLSRLARPDVGIITSIGTAHIGNLGSQAAIAAEKGDIIAGIAPGGTAILPADSAFLPELIMRSRDAGLHVMTHGEAEGADARLLAYQASAEGGVAEIALLGQSLILHLAAPGRHVALNACAVLAAVKVLGLAPDVDSWLQEDGLDPEVIETRITELARARFEAKGAVLDDTIWRQVEKSILLQTLDHHWKEHLSTLDALRQVIYLRAYAQKNPVNEYKQEAFGLFERMLSAIREGVTKTIATNDFRAEEEFVPQDLPELPDFLTTHIDPFTGADNSADSDAASLGLVTTKISRPAVAPGGSDPYAGDPDLRRNDACPCGSGKKYKHCHGAF
jgi:hypothetical protein